MKKIIIILIIGAILFSGCTDSAELSDTGDTPGNDTVDVEETIQ